MNLPNKLTITRLVLAPVLMLWFFLPEFADIGGVLYAVVLVVVFGLMELTDLLDGKIARKRHLVSDLGKVMDPYADSLCHLTFFTCFLIYGIMPVWAFAVILWREFSQSFVRLLMMGRGKPMAANIFGKAKTCLYALSSVCGFAYVSADSLIVLGKGFEFAMYVLFSLSAAASLISFLIYIIDINRSGVLKDMTK